MKSFERVLSEFSRISKESDFVLTTIESALNGKNRFDPEIINNEITSAKESIDSGIIAMSALSTQAHNGDETTVAILKELVDLYRLNKQQLVNMAALIESNSKEFVTLGWDEEKGLDLKEQSV